MARVTPFQGRTFDQAGIIGLSEFDRRAILSKSARCPRATLDRDFYTVPLQIEVFTNHGM